ncbi:unnamed protein product, partial [Ectocarpus fasciculatus]
SARSVGRSESRRSTAAGRGGGVDERYSERRASLCESHAGDDRCCAAPLLFLAAAAPASAAWGNRSVCRFHLGCVRVWFGLSEARSRPLAASAIAVVSRGRK